MGLKFCNEAVMSLSQLYPPWTRAPKEGEEAPPDPPPRTPLQEALVKRLGPNAYPFTMEMSPFAPPSVQLVPAKEYSGAPIGTSYDIRAYVGKLYTDHLCTISLVVEEDFFQRVRYTV